MASPDWVDQRIAEHARHYDELHAERRAARDLQIQHIHECVEDGHKSLNSRIVRLEAGMVALGGLLIANLGGIIAVLMQKGN